jgi:MerC mercury resistance protein
MAAPTFATTTLSPPSWTFGAWLKWLGGGMSLACAVHCALVPVLFMVMPFVELGAHNGALKGLGAAVDWMSHYEFWIVLIGMSISALSIKIHLHNHHQAGVWTWFAMGGLCHAIGLSMSHSQSLLHSGFMVCGGTCMLVAALKTARHQH